MDSELNLPPPYLWAAYNRAVSMWDCGSVKSDIEGNFTEPAVGLYTAEQVRAAVEQIVRENQRLSAYAPENPTPDDPVTNDTPQYAPTVDELCKAQAAEIRSLRNAACFEQERAERAEQELALAGDIVEEARRNEVRAERERDAAVALLTDARMWMNNVLIFIQSREKMHPDGIALFKETLARIDALTSSVPSPISSPATPSLPGKPVVPPES